GWPGAWDGALPSLVTAFLIYSGEHWLKLQAGKYKSQQLANRVVDCGWLNGGVTAGLLLQRAINHTERLGAPEASPAEVEEDGEVGSVTLAALEARDPDEVLLEFAIAWCDHIDAI